MARRWGIAPIAPIAFSTLLALGACGSGQADPDPPTDTGSNDSTSAAVPELGGRIVFNRGEGGTEDIVTYTINPDGRGAQQLFFDGHSENARWSPDGTENGLFCCSDGMVAHFIDPVTGDLRSLEPPDPAVELFCGGAWSPDGERVVCEAYGVEDSSPNGLYWVRSTDGSGLEQIDVECHGEDIPASSRPIEGSVSSSCGRERTARSVPS